MNGKELDLIACICSLLIAVPVTTIVYDKKRRRKTQSWRRAILADHFCLHNLSWLCHQRSSLNELLLETNKQTQERNEALLLDIIMEGVNYTWYSCNANVILSSYSFHPFACFFYSFTSLQQCQSCHFTPRDTYFCSQLLLDSLSAFPFMFTDLSDLRHGLVLFPPSITRITSLLMYWREKLQEKSQKCHTRVVRFFLSLSTSLPNQRFLSTSILSLSLVSVFSFTWLSCLLLSVPSKHLRRHLHLSLCIHICLIPSLLTVHD